MFNIEARPVFSGTVKVTPPGLQEQGFLAMFEALPIEETEQFDLGTPAGAKGFLDRVLLGVDDIVGNDGDPIADSPELRARLIGLAWVRTPLVHAYFGGIQKAAQGN